MKKMLFFILATAASISLANAQKISDKEVPSAVKSALQKNYPNAPHLKWEKEKANYEAEFKMAQEDYSVLLDASGKIVETEIEINVTTLPANIKTYIAKNFPGKKIKEAAKITDAKGALTYEAEVDGKDLLFDSSGTFLKAVNH
ncbi:PepSY-like domain-containing protein [Flavobacterium sp.]|uniref:PepSY-like domain-containing protein n=1 Tax=Flavobacterium sp. TaxID=239 RepID=UPI00261CBD5A|nr:PepSY-like domain-containing protein [Flavobacterium sp.]